MKSRNTTFAVALAVFLAICGPGLAAADAKASKPPNFVLLMADDCSAREFGCYGHTEHKTPNLDTLAKTGVMFRTCWASPICSPSRAEIMTGRYGFRTRWYHDNMKPVGGKTGTTLAAKHRIFAQVLKTRKYATAVCGKWQLPGKMSEYGFDEHCMWTTPAHAEFDGPVEGGETKGRGGVLPGRAARYWHPSIVKNGKPVPTTDRDYGPDLFVDFLVDFAGRHKDGPFLIYYPMCLTHVSWDFEAGRSGYLPVPEVDEAGRKTGRKVRGSLQSNVEYTDRLVGRIVRELETLGIRNNTIVLFTCDNGTAGYGKSRLEMEKGPLVPMIVNGPGIVKAIDPCDALIDFSDVLPTLADLAGATLPDDYVIDGRSFAPVLRGQKRSTREWIFSVFADKRFLRDKRWLLDGAGKFYDCGDSRSGQGYKDVTNSTDAEARAARKRFDDILKDLLAPAPDDPLLAGYQKAMEKQRAKWKTGRKKEPKR